MPARLVYVLALLFALGAGPAAAASFDCAKAATPFEHAICDDPTLSAADDRLTKTYQTAIGGLSPAALEQLRADQRGWLTHARRACTRDARPLTSGLYDERGVSCLVDLFVSRARVLENSRMIEGLRVYPVGLYSAMPDPNEADNPDSYWPLAQHELSFVQIDANESFAHAFNDTIRAEAGRLSGVFDTEDDPAEGSDLDTSDTTNSITLKELAGEARITLSVSTYWYGHGAAHGNWTISYLHYLREEGRLMEARDFFTGKGWSKALLRLAVTALEAEHGDNLMLDDPKYIADVVIDPTRWDLSDPYGLIIQFQPYEVSAYAYGAPTARIAWDDLADYLSETADTIRYGF